MRIALLNQPVNPLRFPLRGDSIGIWNYQVATRLVRQGLAEPVVYSRGTGLTGGETHEIAGATFIDVPAGLDRRIETLRERLAPTAGHTRPAYAAATHFGLYALRAALDMRRRGVDAVAISNYSQFVPIVRRVLPKARILLHMQCYWLSQIDADWIRGRVRASDVITACSRDVAGRIAARFPEVASRCSGLHNGVDTSDFCPDPEEKPADDTLLFIGRVSPEKGVHTMIDAFALVADRHPRLKLRIVGPQSAAPIEYVVSPDPDPLVQSLRRFWEDGRSYLDQMRALVPARLADRVEFVDQIPNEELVHEYRSAALLLFPSVWEEPFGIGNVEAMACGTPVIGTRGGGIPEIIDDGRTGRLVERGDAHELASAIDELISDPARLQTMGRAARESAAEHFEWDRVARDVHAALMAES